MQKRWLCVVLALVLLVGLVPAAVLVAAEGAALVVLSAQNLLVDGEPIECEKYNIDNSNYFKLRDLAYLLNGGGSQFSVGWDAESNTVTISTGEPYDPNGSELVIGEDMSATAQPTAQTIFINGEERSDLSVYNLGGNNFFKLRDLGTALGFDVDYDAETNTAIVTTPGSANTGYTEPTELYREILNIFYTQIVSGWPDGETLYGNNMLSYMFWQFHRNDLLSDVGYAFIDMDGNGIPELLVSRADEFWGASDGMIYDLYTYSDGQMIHLASSGERARFYLGSNNMLHFTGSGGAAYTVYDELSMNQNRLQLHRVLLTDAWTDSVNPWFYGTVEDFGEIYSSGVVGYGIELDGDYSDRLRHISNEEGLNLVNEFDAYQPFDLTLFSSYQYQ